MRLNTIILTAAVGILSIEASAQTLWTNESNTGPSPRRGTATAYDEARDVVVLFGGYLASEVYYGETWLWDGEVWTMAGQYDPEYPSQSPSPRYQSAMAYDSARDVIVLHGGHVQGAIYNDTWEWDGTSWAKNESAGGPARTAHGMSFDSERGVMVMFGGTGHHNDTWEYDGNTWVQRCSECAPPGRELAVLVYDKAREQTILFGGQPLDEGVTWAWNGAEWSMVATTGPTPRAGHSLAYDAQRKLVVLFGGGHWTTLNNETWEWNGLEWREAAPTTPPPPRWSHSVAYDSARQVIVMFGGVGDDYTNPDDHFGDTWIYGPDCDDSDTHDYLDMVEQGADCNGNGILDQCDLEGDVNGDGCVDLADLAALLANYGRRVWDW